MRAYELLYFISPALDDEERTAVNDRVAKAIADIDGTIDSVDEWGKRKLAYEIQDLSEGVYYLVNFNADPNSITELSRVLRINDNVIRFMVCNRVVAEQE